MTSRLLALFVLVGTTFAQTATPPTAATVEVWPEGKMPGTGRREAEAEVPRNDGFHRITNVSRPTLTLFLELRKAGRCWRRVLVFHSHLRPVDDAGPGAGVEDASADVADDASSEGVVLLSARGGPYF